MGLQRPDLREMLLERRPLLAILLRCVSWWSPNQHLENLHSAAKDSPLTWLPSLLYPRPELRGFTLPRIRNEIPAADHFLQVGEATVQVSERTREKCSAAGLLGQGFQGAVCDRGIAILSARKGSCTHGIQRHSATLRTLDSFFQSCAAGVVLAVANDY